MEHFPIIQALCRSALADASPAVRKQIERLRDALKKDGERKQAASLSMMLSGDERTKDMAPERLVHSRSQIPGETLGPNTLLPVDRETSTTLAEILFPGEIRATAPLFNTAVSKAVETIVEEWVNLESLAAVGLLPPKSCLIHGPSGSGKTCLALWIARELDLPVLLARLDGLVSSFLGTTARNIGNLFDFANRHRCILLLDEFDAIAKLRDDPQEVGEIKRVVNALLQNLDTRNDLGLTIGITNHEHLLDPAIWRRFEVQLEIPKPDFRMRVEIVKHFLMPVGVPESHARLMAWVTDGRTGAEIELLVRRYKKSLVVHGQGHGNILDTLRQFTTLNSARVDAARSRQLFADPKDLWHAMRHDPELNLSITEIGEIAGRSKSTVSRQLRRHGDRRPNPESENRADG